MYDQTKIVATLPRILSEKIGWKGGIGLLVRTAGV